MKKKGRRDPDRCPFIDTGRFRAPISPPFLVMKTCWFPESWNIFEVPLISVKGAIKVMIVL